jgi:glycosyltransferase involved in cell wall biosynthesis
MNVLFIPSWYPSITDPLPGIFFREQALGMAKKNKDLNIGISTWGQNDDRMLLWSGEPLKSISKFLLQGSISATQNDLLVNRVVEYFQPTFTWTSSVFHGNMKKIIRANLSNLKKFEDRFGKVDIIHAHVGFPAGHIARVILKVTGIPYVITEQMSPFPHKYFLDKRGNLKGQLREAYQKSARNIAISNALVSEMKRRNVEKLIMIPNLVDEAHFQLAKAAGEKGHFTFFTLGRMVPQKGIDILLEAFANLNIEAVLRIGGDGPYIKAYKKLACDLQIDYRITWLGALDKNQALKEYQNCDAFVLPSRHESMGVVFAEAMACGKPVIATICGGPEEFVDECSGILIPKENKAALSGAMVQMAKSIHQFQPHTIREQFEKRFSTRVVTGQLLNVYSEVVKNVIDKK